MKTWEYKTCMNANTVDLSKFGNEGWELVTVVQANSYKMFYFKREKETNINYGKDC